MKITATYTKEGVVHAVENRASSPLNRFPVMDYTHREAIEEMLKSFIEARSPHVRVLAIEKTESFYGFEVRFSNDVMLKMVPLKALTDFFFLVERMADYGSEG